MHRCAIVFLLACSSSPPPRTAEPVAPPAQAAVPAPAPAAAPPPVEAPVDENANLPEDAKPFGIKASELDKAVAKLGDLVRVGGEMKLTTKAEADHAVGTAEESDKARAHMAAAVAYAALHKRHVMLANDITAQRTQIAEKRKTHDAPHWEQLDDRLRTSATMLKDIGIQYRAALTKPDPRLEKLLEDAAK